MNACSRSSERVRSFNFALVTRLGAPCDFVPPVRPTVARQHHSAAAAVAATAAVTNHQAMGATLRLEKPLSSSRSHRELAVTTTAAATAAAAARCVRERCFVGIIVY